MKEFAVIGAIGFLIAGFTGAAWAIVLSVVLTVGIVAFGVLLEAK